MKHALFLAWHALLWHRSRSIIVVLSLAITIWLPATVHLMLNEFRREISERSHATPLIVGARGSRIDLVLHALYFKGVPPAEITMAEVQQLTESGLGIAVPLHSRYQTPAVAGQDGVPIVGTSPEYMEFRRLTIQSGEMLSMLGDCIVGARVAQVMQLAPGDTLFSAPRNAFNLAGDYPLRMSVTGILAPSHSPDDDVVFTDIRTTWVIDGIGHGHQSVTSQTNPALLLGSNDSSALIANAGVLPYTEITKDNIDSFHFHGEPNTFPLTAIIVVPADEKSRVRILGRYASSEMSAQCLKPPEVVEELLTLVFRVEQLVWLCSLAAGLVTLLLLILVLTLSMRLRAEEMQTMFQLGCSRSTIALLQGSEILLSLLLAGTLASAATGLTVWLGGDVLSMLLF